MSRSQILQEGQRFGSGMKYGINARSELSLVAATGKGQPQGSAGQIREGSAKMPKNLGFLLSR